MTSTAQTYYVIARYEAPEREASKNIKTLVEIIQINHFPKKFNVRPLYNFNLTEVFISDKKKEYLCKLFE